MKTIFVAIEVVLLFINLYFSLDRKYPYKALNAFVAGWTFANLITLIFSL